jgi:hypothetical protein
MTANAWCRCFVVCALAFLGACSEPQDPGSRVVSLRVLAQETDLPYARPGESVHIRSLAFDPQGRTIEWAWAVCVNPNSSEALNCIGQIVTEAAASGTLTLLARGPGVDAVDVVVPDDVLTSLPEAARSNASLGVLSVACPGTLTLEPGAADLPFRCTEADSGRVLGLDEFIVGVKRIVVRNVDRNQNPVIARVTFDDSDWPENEVRTVSPCSETGNDVTACADNLQHELSAQVTPDSFEHGETEWGDSFDEQLIVQYFATEGNFESEVRVADSPKNKWAPRQQAGGTDVTLWFVAHDSRGGVNWATRRVHVE